MCGVTYEYNEKLPQGDVATLPAERLEELLDDGWIFIKKTPALVLTPKVVPVVPKPVVEPVAMKFEPKPTPSKEPEKKPAKRAKAKFKKRGKSK